MYRNIEHECKNWDELNLVSSLTSVMKSIEDVPNYNNPFDEISFYKDCTSYVKFRLVKEFNLDGEDCKDKEIHNLYLSSGILERMKYCKKKSELQLLINEFRNEFIYDLEKVINKLDLLISTNN